jgi:hypothetical protein
MPIPDYELDEPIDLFVSYIDPDTLEPVDPEDVTLRVRSPAGDISTYTFSNVEIEQLGTGYFRRTIFGTMVGDWYWDWKPTGNVGDVEAGMFAVRESRVGTPA